MTETIRILSPAGRIWAERKASAARPVSLQGLRPGILENSKANALSLMESMISGLSTRVPLGAVAIGHKPVAMSASRSTVEMLRSSCDFALVGTSD